jgi:hypothetical protein
MSLDTTIRFLTPVDPRAVWTAMSAIIEAPADYTWERYPYNPNMGSLFAPNPTWNACSGQGAQAVATMIYGAEGSLLNDDEYEGVPAGQLPPPAYVELTLTNGAKDRHPEFLEKIIAWAGAPVAVQDDYAGTWQVHPAGHYRK